MSDTLSRKKKLVQISSYSRARFIALSDLKIRLKCSHVHSRAIQYKHTPYSARTVPQIFNYRQYPKSNPRIEHENLELCSFHMDQITWLPRVF